MSNLMSMFSVGLSGLLASQTQINIVGHNTANIKNNDYTKQRVNLVNVSALRDPQGAFGMGVKVESITRVYDALLAKTVRNEGSSLSYWKNSQNLMSEISLYFNEFQNDGLGLGESLTQYFNAWQELANTPPDKSDESYIKRTNLVKTAQTMATELSSHIEKLSRIEENIDNDIISQVQEINTLTKNIAALNKEIVLVESDGSHANDLRDNRDALLNKLSSYGTIEVVEKENGNISVFFGGMSIVDNDKNYLLSTPINERGKIKIEWSTGLGDRNPINITERIYNGKIASNIKVRDEIIPSYKDELNKLARTLIEETNKLHSSGQGLKRFTSSTSSNNVSHPRFPINDQPGAFPYPVTNGAFQLHVYDKEGKIEKTYDIPLDPSTDSLLDLVSRISSIDGSAEGGDLQASLTVDNKIRISVASGKSFSFGNDSTGFLVAAGFNNFFKGTNASNIGVDDLVLENPEYIATSSAGVPGDNSVAKSIVDMQFKPVASDNSLTIGQYYGYIAGKVASEKQQIDIFTKTKTISYDDYNGKLKSLTGVSMEDEMADMMQFQRAYQSNARYINAVDEMLNTIINGMGLVGR